MGATAYLALKQNPVSEFFSVNRKNLVIVRSERYGKETENESNRLHETGN